MLIYIYIHISGSNASFSMIQLPKCFLFDNTSNCFVERASNTLSKYIWMKMYFTQYWQCNTVPISNCNISALESSYNTFQYSIVYYGLWIFPSCYCGSVSTTASIVMIDLLECIIFDVFGCTVLYWWKTYYIISEGVFNQISYLNTQNYP